MRLHLQDVAGGPRLRDVIDTEFLPRNGDGYGGVIVFRDVFRACLRCWNNNGYSMPGHITFAFVAGPREIQLFCS
jgi:hypothetical protein